MSPKDGHQARSVARLAAVQSLFQMELAEHDVDAVVRDYLDHRIGVEIDGAEYAMADAVLFESLVRGTVEHQIAIDGALDRCLSVEWPLHRLDSILRAILRTACFEMIMRPEIPARVVLNEYVDIARAFFDGSEATMANGVLDRLARAVRAQEFEKKPIIDGAA